MQTVQVKSPVSEDNPNGFIVINAEDFDPAVHEPFSQDDAEILGLGDEHATAPKAGKAKK